MISETNRAAIAGGASIVFGSGSAEAEAFSSAAAQLRYGAGAASFSIADYSPNPSDIGPAVASALAAAKAAGGGRVYIPPRGGDLLWGWQTQAYVDCGSNIQISVFGEPGATKIRPAGTQPGEALLYVRNSIGTAKLSGLMWIGDAGVGDDAPCLAHIAGLSVVVLEDCGIYGVQCSLAEHGCIRLAGLNTVVRDVFVGASRYVGTSRQGGVISIHGATNGAYVNNLRCIDISTTTIGGVATDAVKYGTKSWIWFRGQEEPSWDGGQGGIVLDNCMFDEASDEFQVDFSPISTLQYGAIYFRGCAFNVPPLVSGRGAIRVKNAASVDIEGCGFGLNGGYLADLESVTRFRISRSRITTASGGKTVRVRAGVGYVEVDECANVVFDTNIASPSNGIRQINGTRTVIYP